MIQVTIAIPVYNVEKYIHKCLSSALNQDFPYQYEILIIDDQGNDKSMDIIQKMLSSHPKKDIVRIISHEKNKGLGPARNTAIKEAFGKYLFFLDSDDWIDESCLSILFQKAEETSSEITCGSVYRISEATGNIEQKQIFKDQVINHDFAGVFMLINNIYMNIEVWNKLFLLDFLRRNHIQCIHRIIEDSIFDFKARIYAKKICLVSKATLFYNIRENSILTNIFQKKGSEESAVVFCDIIKQIQNEISSSFNNIPGIYDLYYLRITQIFSSIYKTKYTEQQNSFINEQIKDYNKIIPDLKSLKRPQYRLQYLFCKRNPSYQHFVKIFSQQEIFPFRCIRKILSFL